MIIYRLGIDVGTNSIGWCMLLLNEAGEPIALIDLGTVIFQDGRDPQSGTSLAVDRRVARGMRRRRDRMLRRRSDLMSALIRFGLMPADESTRKVLEFRDPYELRARGLDEKLSLFELGRAIFHLHQRRGFKSNRKAEKKGEEEGKIKEAISHLKKEMDKDNARTFGEFLARRHAKREPVRARLNGEGAKASYDFYPDRGLTEQELDLLWSTQAKYHGDSLSEDALISIKGTLLRQRPLKPVDPGKCALEPSERRAPRALPLAQLFRILQELANLRIVSEDLRERSLTADQRDELLVLLQRREKLNFEQMARKLGLASGERFNLASEKREYLKGDETAKALSHKTRFDKAWHKLARTRQTEVVERLLAEEDETTLVAWLMSDCGLDEAAARNTANARLPDGFSRLGRTALGKVSKIMGRAEAIDPESGEVLSAPIGYAAAARVAGYHHSDRHPDELLDRLPYYGEALSRHVSGTGDPADALEKRVGRISNPTVHIGLNRLRRLVNDIIEEYGRPTEIVVELARELKLSREEKQRRQTEQAENQKKNEVRRAKLVELGQTDNGENRLRLRLWEELNPGEPHNRRCIYTGRQISIEMLFGPEVEVDHILPFSKTLDNSAANKILGMRFANRAKGNRSPADAFASNPTIAGFHYEWSAIQVCAQNLPVNKRWRFAEDAMQRFEKDRGFLDRQLVDTQYLARLSREYLCHVCPSNRVWVTPGRLTQMLRGKWGLNQLLSDHNQKNRTDHRHHAVDAFVTGLTDRTLLKRIAAAADQTRDRLIEDMPEPWEGFRDQLRARLDSLVVFHRPDHGAQGKLHEETAHGFVRDPAAEEGNNLVYRRPFAQLNENEIARIRDKRLRAELQQHLLIAKEQKIPIKDAIAEFNRLRTEQGLPAIRHIRLLKKEAEVVPIPDRNGKAYKAYSPGDNHRIEIFETPDGRWHGEPVWVFHANQRGYLPVWNSKHPGARLVMKVHKGDLIALDNGEREEIMRVARLDAKASRFKLSPHNEAGNLDKRHADIDDPFRWLMISYNRLKERKARLVRVDRLGRVRDSGPPS